MAETVPETIILSALVDRMKTFTTALPVQLPDEPIDVPADRKFIELIYLPNDTERVTIDSDGRHRYYGIFQPTVHWPIAQGQLDPYRLAGEIADHFAADTKMIFDGASVRSMQRPTVERAVKEGPDLLVAVTVEYEAYI